MKGRVGRGRIRKKYIIFYQEGSKLATHPTFRRSFWGYAPRIWYDTLLKRQSSKIILKEKSCFNVRRSTKNEFKPNTASSAGLML
ncbi:MAG: hypothetical protein JGK01_27870 [Microcoleus sp. PH2017_03_ELD_O_A]|uniref:hypothetical protein n=1 Tax=unclassified Microcoleus TaxID=2642155 RepID=UPI001D9DE2CC|nr:MULTISPECIES: hypothetical protein [unclassified Microcoleus]MCC3445412.1 hypothetical protein [Microcoleus sp. PH2017_03_ELD_O_A]MCC3457603.1 hypothetical protein [Microcoleus sp. PH2017_08_TRC_O_A]MCC3484994.1 hypothetical protein [Microcoleus sp. PH2017_14_LAR_D_A]MCC3505246.1 hypothetical protein [Microcoleus sp. PH2017_19_SFW_U_A]MCC3511280.1 hypothetical protein [Microcoleus sp. PH2017_17_BER_D_A]MCC3523501.1 hypothetical protein [Microcoleus sp. PH2017_20_SFW_D_A]MCC3556472.1 hypot